MKTKRYESTPGNHISTACKEAEQRNAELVAALRPFAGAAKLIGYAQGNFGIWARQSTIEGQSYTITVQHLRDAADAIARAESATPAVVQESLTTESATPAKHPDTERLVTLLESALKSFAAMPEANPSHTRDGIWALWTDGCNTLRDAIDAARKQEASK